MNINSELDRLNKLIIKGEATELDVSNTIESIKIHLNILQTAYTSNLRFIQECDHSFTTTVENDFGYFDHNKPRSTYYTRKCNICGHKQEFMLGLYTNTNNIPDWVMELREENNVG